MLVKGGPGCNVREERSLINGSAKETVFLDGTIINGVSGDTGEM